MNKILIIDDEQDVADALKTTIQEAIEGSLCYIELDFAASIDRIVVLRPDAIVLDLMEGKQSGNLPGQLTWRSVWEGNFCPVIIYSGSEADLQPPVPISHPFVTRIAKGGGSLEQVVSALRKFAPASAAVRKLHDEVGAVIQQVLRDTAGDGHMPMENDTYLLHAGRRRIAAEMDGNTVTGNRPMLSWEQYLLPAMGSSPLTADLLRKRESEWNDPTAYRLVLTPSCDLVQGRCEPTLIAACCEGPSRLAQKLSLSLLANRADRDAETVVSKALTVGAFAGFLPLPGFPSKLPVMVANLKGLEVIKWDSVGPSNSTTHDFLRIASIDSPFREQVSWAYLTTAARPGMPARELKSWAEEIVRAATPIQVNRPPA